MNADFIKIDGSLVKNIDVDKNALLVVETIVEFAKKLGVKTIAEHVHSSMIMDIVRELGVDYSQGFYIDEPSINLSNPK
jgi:EAL domain-containing protein (putative c-di-GMP-specific phosphodiesterase class I)